MPKVIISFLGTGGYSDNKKRNRGEYRLAKYFIGNEIYQTTFVAEALFKHYNADKIIYIGTLKSMWEVVYDNKTFIKNPLVENWEKLAESVESSSHTTPIEKEVTILDVFEGTLITPVLLKYGLNDRENEYNIKKLFQIDKFLNDNDKLYLDISHSFRSLPIVLINVLNFIIENSNKNLSLENISYGMFEVSNEMGDVSPIVNLNIIKELGLNIKAAHEFTEYGNAYLFSQLLEKTDKSLASILKSFSDSKSLNHFYDLKKKIQQLKGVKYDKLNSIQSATLPKTINDFISRFVRAKGDSHYQYEIARWMHDKKQYGAASIALIESLITKVCELEQLDASDRKQRDCAKMMIYLAGKSDKSIKKEIKKSNLICEKGVLQGSKKYASFHDVWGDINKIRKSVSHSIGTQLPVTKMVKDLGKYIEDSSYLIYSKASENL